MAAVAAPVTVVATRCAGTADTVAEVAATPGSESVETAGTTKSVRARGNEETTGSIVTAGTFGTEEISENVGTAFTVAAARGVGVPGTMVTSGTMVILEAVVTPGSVKTPGTVATLGTMVTTGYMLKGETVGTSEMPGTRGTVGSGDKSGTGETTETRNTIGTRDNFETRDNSGTRDTVGTRETAGTREMVGTKGTVGTVATTATTGTNKAPRTIETTRSVMTSGTSGTTGTTLTTRTVGNTSGNGGSTATGSTGTTNTIATLGAKGTAGTTVTTGTVGMPGTIVTLGSKAAPGTIRTTGCIETAGTIRTTGTNVTPRTMKTRSVTAPGTIGTATTMVTTESNGAPRTRTSGTMTRGRGATGAAAGAGDRTGLKFLSFLYRERRVRGRPRVPRPSQSHPDYPRRSTASVLLASPGDAPAEAIENRSKTIEEILEVLKKGCPLWKIRSFTKWYRRTYVLDDKRGLVRYEPSRKNPCFRTPLEILVDDIVDVRKGWKTDTFNKIEKKVEQRKLKFPTLPAAVDERCCFSIIYGRSKQSLDLLAPDPKMADLWVRGLRHIVTVLKGLHQEERFERWLELQFREADADNNNGLNFEEALKLLKQLNVKMPRNTVKKLFEESNTVKHTRNGEQVLDADEFVLFFMKLMSRSDIKEIYQRYTKNNKEMTAADLVDFIHKEQKGHTVTKEECLSLIEAFEQSNLKMEGKISLIGFTNMLMSEQFDVFKQSHKVVYQNMYQPLSHYYIATSHNTYLTGNQLHGESSVEGYIDALKQGCRCVELDCWDGPDGEPIIYHGYTLTSKILFRDVLLDAIKPYAFYSSEYPVILSLENHLSGKQQEVLTKHLIEVLGDMLYTTPVDESWEFLPSPETLMRKIIVKAKKKSSAGLYPNDEVDSEDETEPPPGVHLQSTPLKGKAVVTTALSSLVNVCEAVHFHSFEDTEANGKCYQMSSFSEAKANKFIETKSPEFIRYNTKHLSRIYPAGTRADSSNFKPIPYWNVGCQLVALNYQHAGKPMLYNDAKFTDNGGCGYVLKPEYLRRRDKLYPELTPNTKNQVTLKLTVISGQHMPKEDQDAEGEIVDPYVKVKIIGHPDDNQKGKTEAVRNNGFNPQWNHDMSFLLKWPELAMVHFCVKDLSTTGKDVTLGTYALPFLSLQEGYSHVYLKDYSRNFVSPASLFIQVCLL